MIFGVGWRDNGIIVDIVKIAAALPLVDLVLTIMFGGDEADFRRVNSWIE